ncbi:MAG: hypothetical protein LUH54_02200, partial [Firmicutes bacterium]|nr:hypothetical protein [Bacillota bacterium]
LSMTLFSLPASAYGNGGASVYNSSGTKLGTGDIWTNNKSESELGKKLSGELVSTEKSTLTIKVGYTVVDNMQAGDADTYWAQKTATSATVISTTKTVSDDVTPVDARGYFKINSRIARVCKRYNFGDGVSICSSGPNCEYLGGR